MRYLFFVLLQRTDRRFNAAADEYLFDLADIASDNEKLPPASARSDLLTRVLVLCSLIRAF